MYILRSNYFQPVVNKGEWDDAKQTIKIENIYELNNKRHENPNSVN